MKGSDVALAILVAAVWGAGFVFSKLTLETFSPSQLVALRFLVTALPAVALARPRVPWRVLIPIGLTLFAGQFLFQFLGIANGMPPGLAAVIVQTQALFTVLFAMLIGESPTARDYAGMGIATAGLGCIAATVGGDSMTFLGLGLTMVSPIAFAVGNILLKQLAGRYRTSDMLGLMTWLALVPPLPMLALSLQVDGAGALVAALQRATWFDAFAIFYMGIISTTLGYAVWGALLHKYAATQVAPFALLVPVMAAAASWLVLGERFGPLRLAGIVLVLAGVSVVFLPVGRRQKTLSAGLRQP
jgi:O-acetylserine/cysteine efflux transporter